MAKETKAKTKEDEVGTTALKRRNADGTKGTVMKTKPKRMNLVRPKRMAAKTVDATNPELIVFPTDVFGLTKEIKHAVTRAVSKVSGDKKKLALIEETLDILRDHAHASFKQSKDTGVLKRRTLVESASEVLTPSEDETASVDGSEGLSEGSEEVVETTPNKDKSKKRTRKTKKGKK